MEELFKKMEKFYLTDYDFQIYVNKNCQTYKRSWQDELRSPITVEYYKSLQKGGCNEKRENRRKDIESASATESPSSDEI